MSPEVTGVAGLLSRLSRFLLVGAVCTGLQYVLLAVGVEVLGLSAVVASSIGFVASAAVNYAANRRLTFGSEAPHVRAAPRFVAVLVIAMALNVLFMQLLHGYLGWHYLAAQVLTTVVTLAWNFIAHGRWTFVDAPTRQGRGG